MRQIKNQVIAALFLFSITSCGIEVQAPKRSPQQDELPSSKIKTKTSEPTDKESPGSSTEDMNAAGSPMEPLSNLKEIVSQIGITPFHGKAMHAGGVRIAVLDNGFRGWREALGTQLPRNTVLDAGLENAEADTSHGTRMAEIAYAVTRGNVDAPGSSESNTPSIKLYNTNGYSNFEHAVRQAIQDKVDVILYSQVWEYSGNGDGHGFINKLVNEATDHGIVWVNAAGNNGLSTYQTRIEQVAGRGLVALPYQGQFVRLRVPYDGTPVRIVLSWNDFTESNTYMTSQDLDLRLTDCGGTTLQESTLIQAGEDPAGREGYSAHAREILKVTLKKGEYCLSVPMMTRNFNSGSKLRLTADGYQVTFTDRSDEGQLLIPADNSSVITVGASDVAYSATSFLSFNDFDFHPDLRSAKSGPDLKVNSEVRFGAEEVHSGSSSAAAIAAGAIAVLRGVYGPTLTSAEVHKRIQNGTLLSSSPGTWSERNTGVQWNAPSLVLQSPF